MMRLFIACFEWNRRTTQQSAWEGSRLHNEMHFVINLCIQHYCKRLESLSDACFCREPNSRTYVSEKNRRERSPLWIELEQFKCLAAARGRSHRSWTRSPCSTTKPTVWTRRESICIISLCSHVVRPSNRLSKTQLSTHNSSLANNSSRQELQLGSNTSKRVLNRCS